MRNMKAIQPGIWLVRPPPPLQTKFSPRNKLRIWDKYQTKGLKNSVSGPNGATKGSGGAERGPKRAETGPQRAET